MTNAPPATLKKAYTSMTGTGDRGKKFIISTVAAYIIIDFAGRISRLYAVSGTSNYLIHFYLVASIIVGISTWALVRDDAIFYKVSNVLDFLIRWIKKSDFVYKHDEKKTSDKQLQKHTKVRNMNEETGIIVFDKLPTYKSYKCNAGFVLVVNPQDVQNLDDFNERTALLLYSIRPGIQQKYHTIQSQDISDIAGQYEERLKLPPEAISPQERAGLFYTKQFLTNLTNRVNWAYFIFIGAGYYTDLKEANLQIDRIRKSYELFLNNSGVESRLIKSQWEYSVIVKQMRSLKNIGVITVD
jgi:hypothetical protein